MLESLGFELGVSAQSAVFRVQDAKGCGALRAGPGAEVLSTLRVFSSGFRRSG